MKNKLFGIFIAAFITLLTGCSQIDTGNVGVERTLGQVKPDTLQPGVYLTLFKTVDEIIAKEVPVQINDLKPQTSDKITLQDLDIDVYVQIDPAQAAKIMTKWPGDLTSIENSDGRALGLNYITRQAREAVYTAVARRGSATVHTERSAIAADVVKDLQASLDAEAGKGMFSVRSVNVRNLVTDQALEANIKAAAQAQFKLQEEKNRLAVAEVEADRKRAEARGEADAIRIKSEAVSKQGGAEYVQLQWIQKWNGVVPTHQLTNSCAFVGQK